MNYLLHDYLFEELCSKCSGTAFYKNLILYCSVKPAPDDDEIEKFSICIGNPEGIQLNYVSLLQTHREVGGRRFFIPEKLIVFDLFEESHIITEVKKIISSCGGDDQQSAILKMLEYFNLI